MLLPDYRLIRKKAEISWIQIVIAESMSSRTENNHNKCNSILTQVKSIIKGDFKNSFQDLANSVEGKFGKKIREEINIEIEKIERL